MKEIGTTNQSKMNESSSSQVEYTSEAELLAEFKRYMCDPLNVERATQYLYNSLVEETIMGVVFELHYLHKTGLDVALKGEAEDSTVYVNVSVDLPWHIGHELNSCVLAVLSFYLFLFCFARAKLLDSALWICQIWTYLVR